MPNTGNRQYRSDRRVRVYRNTVGSRCVTIVRRLGR